MSGFRSLLNSVRYHAITRPVVNTVERKIFGQPLRKRRPPTGTLHKLVTLGNTREVLRKLGRIPKPTAPPITKAGLAFRDELYRMQPKFARARGKKVEAQVQAQEKAQRAHLRQVKNEKRRYVKEQAASEKQKAAMAKAAIRQRGIHGRSIVSRTQNITRGGLGIGNIQLIKSKKKADARGVRNLLASDLRAARRGPHHSPLFGNKTLDLRR